MNIIIYYPHLAICTTNTCITKGYKNINLHHDLSGYLQSLTYLFVQVSFDLSEYTANVDAVGTLRILDAIRTCGLTKSVKFYQASTSELYGKVQEIPQKETTPFYPRSPYGNLAGYTVTEGYGDMDMKK